jgi:hypothetical protein
MTEPEHGRYPGYNVLDKRHTMSWNEITRRVVDHRIAVPREPRYFSPSEWGTLNAVCGRIVPQPKDRPPVPLAALIDQKMLKDGDSGFRIAPLPYQGEAWKRGLHALDEEARSAYSARFSELAFEAQDALLKRMEEGELKNPAWGDMPSKMFFSKRIVVDIPAAYYSYPTAWNEIGWGGPASPRGYVRTEINRRDPWEAVEAQPGKEAEAREKNRHVG